MSNFFLGPNFRDKLTMGTVNPMKFSAATKEELEVQQQEVVEEPKKEKVKGKQDGKES